MATTRSLDDSAPPVRPAASCTVKRHCQHKGLVLGCQAGHISIAAAWTSISFIKDNNFISSMMHANIKYSASVIITCLQR